MLSFTIETKMRGVFRYDNYQEPPVPIPPNSGFGKRQTGKESPLHQVTISKLILTGGFAKKVNLCKFYNREYSLESLWILEGYYPKTTIKFWKDIDFSNKIESPDLL